MQSQPLNGVGARDGEARPPSRGELRSAGTRFATAATCFRPGSGGREPFAREARRRAGFTLLEMLIVIALIGVFSALFVVNYDSMLRQSEADAVETTFWRAVREARTRALLERRPQALRFEEKAAEFVVEEPGETRGLVFAIPRETWAPDTKLEVKLQKRVPPSQFTLVQGELVELREIPEVNFFPDGTCVPFSLTYEVGGEEATLEIDPWTGAQLLKADEG